MHLRVPQYCRQRNSGRPDRAYVTVNGKRFWLGQYGSPESVKLYCETINNLEPAPAARSTCEAPPPAETSPQADAAPRSARPSVTELLAEYLQHAAKEYGSEKHNELVHFKSIAQILYDRFGDTLAEHFSPLRYKNCREAMIAKGWSRSYIGDQCSRLKRFFAWAVEEERVPPSVFEGVKAVRGLRRGRTAARETEPVRPVDDATVDATLPFLSETVADMVRVQRLCGCRPGELVQMAREHIDRTEQVWRFRPPRHKTQHKGKTRVIVIGPQAQAILAKYLLRDRCFPYSTASYRRAVTRGCEKAGVEHWNPNRLRHTAATAVRSQFGLEAAQVTLGHSSAEVTQIYAERDDRLAVEVALRMG